MKNVVRAALKIITHLIILPALLLFLSCEKHSSPSTAISPVMKWNIQKIPAFGYWRSVAFGNGRFVAAGFSSDTAITSTDGINWQTIKLPSSSNWQSLAYGNGIFVLLSSKGDIITSSDGLSWVNNYSSVDNGEWSWNCVTFGNGIFVAVQISGLYNNGRSNQFAISKDGITWNLQNVPSSYWSSVVYGNGIFVAVSDLDGYAITSADGISWGNQTNIGQAQSITFGNGLFIAGFNLWDVVTSADGKNWSNQQLPTHIGYTSLFFGSDLFIAASSGISGTTTSTFATSKDGIKWSTQAIPINERWNSVAFGNGVFVAVAEGSEQIATSSCCW